MENTLKRDVKNIDELEKKYQSDYHFRFGVSPGVTFFVMEDFAFEVQLDLLGYDLKISEKEINDENPSREVRQNVDFNIYLLSLQFGLAYYF